MSQSKVLVTASILSADLSKLQAEIDTIEKHADWIQVDVMDGHFVPNLTFGAPLIKTLKTKLAFDIHLMVSNPADRLAEFFAVPGVKNITFHAEAVPKEADRMKIIQTIHTAGIGAGIAISPATPVSAIDDVLSIIDVVLIMSVDPGFAGQAFHPEVLPKIEELHKRYPDLMIQVDGGIDAQTGKKCRDAGATNLVSASFIFSASDRAESISQLRGL